MGRRGFDVRVRQRDGRDAHDKHEVPNNFTFERQAKNQMTVQEWKDKRFWLKFPGYDVDVLLNSGDVAAGNMLLGNVRDSYADED